MLSFLSARYYNNFLEGEFILYRHKTMPYEVPTAHNHRACYMYMDACIYFAKMLKKLLLCPQDGISSCVQQKGWDVCPTFTFDLTII